MDKTSNNTDMANSSTETSSVPDVQDNYSFEFLEDLFVFKTSGTNIEITKKDGTDFKTSEIVEALKSLDVEVTTQKENEDKAIYYTPRGKTYVTDVMLILETIVDLLPPEVVPKDRSVELKS